jgi:hypothetical protein
MKIMPRENSMYTEPCTIRLTRLPGVRKLPLRLWKITAMMISPAITGRAPVSPARTRAIQLLT